MTFCSALRIRSYVAAIGSPKRRSSTFIMAPGYQRGLGETGIVATDPALEERAEARVARPCLG